jgi:hypothetical protein
MVYNHSKTASYETATKFNLIQKLLFFHMFTVKRLHRLTDYKESSPEGLSMLNMLPPYILSVLPVYTFSTFGIYFRYTEVMSV